jgi:hypothetical protein
MKIRCRYVRGTGPQTTIKGQRKREIELDQPVKDPCGIFTRSGKETKVKKEVSEVRGRRRRGKRNIQV